MAARNSNNTPSSYFITNPVVAALKDKDHQVICYGGGQNSIILSGMIQTIVYNVTKFLENRTDENEHYTISYIGSRLRRTLFGKRIKDAFAALPDPIEVYKVVDSKLYFQENIIVDILPLDEPLSTVRGCGSSLWVLDQMPRVKHGVMMNIIMPTMVVKNVKLYAFCYMGEPNATKMIKDAFPNRFAGMSSESDIPPGFLDYFDFIELIKTRAFSDFFSNE